MPPRLHRRLLEQAEAEGVSLNQHIVTLLAEASALQAVRCELSNLRHDLQSLRQRIDSWDSYRFDYWPRQSDEQPQDFFRYADMRENGYAIQG
jgi:hypothetical protein